VQTGDALRRASQGAATRRRRRTEVAPHVYNRFAGSTSIGHAVVRRLDGENERPMLAGVIEMLDRDSSGDQWLQASDRALSILM
jgi:hypothetical protein